MPVSINNEIDENNYKLMFFSLLDFIDLHSSKISSHDLAFCLLSSGAQIAYKNSKSKQDADSLIKEAVEDGLFLSNEN